MRIYIRGESKKIDLVEVRDATRFYLNKLLKPKYRDVSIKIELIKNLRKTQNGQGFCGFDGKKKFLIELDSGLKHSEAIEVLAHECVHIKQYITKEMVDYDTIDKVKWQGKKYAWNPNMIADEDYFFLPWEIDAFGRSPGLLHAYYKHKEAHRKA
jgi:hypothetical protein